MASCNTASITEKDATVQAQQKTIDSMKIEMVRQQVIDSMNEMARMQFVIPQMINSEEYAVNAETPKPKATAKKKSTPKKTVAKAKTTTKKRSTATSSSSSSAGNGGVAQASNTPVYEPAPVYQEPAPVVVPQQEKKGWSAKAKGAVVGAGVGAAAGAIINKKNRGAGAIIGGVLGAGAGTGIGAIIDKKQGR